MQQSGESSGVWDIPVLFRGDTWRIQPALSALPLFHLFILQ